MFFLSVLIGDGKSCSNCQSRLKYSFAQNLIYSVTNGRVKTPKSIFIPTMVKTLTNNTKLINILNKLSHGVSCIQCVNGIANKECVQDIQKTVDK